MNPDERIRSIHLQGSIKNLRSVEAEHERDVAIADILHENVFDPIAIECGPYDVNLTIEDNRLVFDIQSDYAENHMKVAIPVTPLRRTIRDYFLICESYYNALKGHSCGKIEAIDMGRRGVHNDGAEMLKEMLGGKIIVDHDTARRLFTLICVLHIK